MRRSTLIWAGILILAGILLLLNNIGVIAVDVWGLIWPLLLIAFGASILWGGFFGRPSLEAERIAIPLGGAVRARVVVKHAAGRLRVDASATSGELVTGTFGSGLDHRERRDGETLDVEMRVPNRAFPGFAWPWMWGPGRTLDWTFGLNGKIPLSLEFETGAGEAQLNLSDLQVTDLRLKTGASATDLTLPANAGHTRVKIDAGAASVTVRVPAGVAAHIRATGGLVSVNVDRNRFPREGNAYRSPDYETATNTVDVGIEAGVGSISVR
jgi:hypothetical protein